MTFDISIDDGYYTVRYSTGGCNRTTTLLKVLVYSGFDNVEYATPYSCSCTFGELGRGACGGGMHEVR